MYVNIDDEVTDYFKVYFMDGLTGSIEIFIDNASYSKFAVSDFEFDPEDAFGCSYIYLDNLSFGPHTYNITYTGEDYTLSKPFEGEFNRIYIFEVSLNAESENSLYFGNDVTFDIQYPYDADGEILVTYNGKNVTKKVDPKDNTSGQTQVILSDLNIGENNINFTFKSDKCPEKSVIKTVDVSARFGVPYPMRYGNDDDMVYVVLPSDAKGNLVIYVSRGLDKDWNEKWELVSNVTLVDGKAKASVFSLGLGEFKYNIEYEGDDYGSYIEKIDYNYFLIVPDFIYDSSIYVKGNNSVKVVLPDNVSDTLTVSYKPIIGDGEYGEAQTIYNGVANGTVTIQLPELEVGKYAFEVQYGVDNYPEYNFEVKENASGNESGDTNGSGDNKTNTTVPVKIVAKDLTVYHNDGKKYTVTVYGTDGRAAVKTRVTFKINGKKVGSAVTNDKGIATLKITQLPKSYKITAEALGASVTKNLKVNPVLKLKKVKVKRSAKKLVITATLKQGKKVLKNKKITFKFNGKKYTAKTNKKGVAKVTIQKKVLKKLKVGKKVKYQATYLKYTVKQSVKVKK